MDEKLIQSKAAFHLWATLFIAAGLGAGYFLDSIIEKQCYQKYEFINPRLGCGPGFSIDKSSYNNFRSELSDSIEKEKAEGNVYEVSIFFRDLESGPTFGINELEDYSPASLLKLPLALTLFHLEQDHPGTFEEVYKYTKTPEVIAQVFPPEKSLEQDVEYSVEEMVYYLVVYSDNVAYNLLMDYLRSSPERMMHYYQTLQDIGIADPKNPLHEIINTHSYASIFRQLYNSSFLNGADSEKMLSFLVDAKFNQGIVKGVPEGIKVANKFGERQYPDKTKQLHDCGIVYYPKNPYVLCVMTKGKDWDKLSAMIQSISRQVYEEIDSRRI